MRGTVKTKSEFNKIFNKGIRLTGQYINAIILKGTKETRLGIIINSKYGGSVERNRAKRVIKEAFREIVKMIKTPTEIIIMPKGPIRGIGKGEAKKDLMSMVEKSGIA